MKRITIASILALTCVWGVTAAAPVHKPSRHHRDAAGSESALAAQARITKSAATATALAKVPNGKVKTVELEREHGKLVYSFDLTVAGKPGVDEVQVDALDGSVVSAVHESAKAEKKEAQAEKSEHH